MRRIIVLICAVLVTKAYKILVYNPTIGHSHVNFIGTIADILVDAGHEVTTLSPIIDPFIGFGTKRSTIIAVQPHEEVRTQFEGSKFNLSYFEFPEFNPIVPFIVGPILAKPFYLTCEKVVNEPGLIEQLRNEHFDLMLTENFDVCGMGMSNAIEPKSVIGLSSSFPNGFHFDEFGIEEANSYVPAKGTSHLDVHSVWSRFYNCLNAFLEKVMFFPTRYWINGVLRKRFGNDYPSVQEQSNDVAFFMANYEPLLDWAGPMSSRLIPIGGITAQSPKELDEYWKSVLSLRSRTIIISFGTVAESYLMPIEMKRSISQAILSFPDVTFIWKYEIEDGIGKGIDNLVLAKWVPQVDLLNDHRVKLFITHAGMGSTLETAYRGVPGLFVPLFGDQLRNAAMMEKNGLGKVFPKDDLKNSAKIVQAIKLILEDKKYGATAANVATKLNNKPFSAKQMLVKHVEFTAEYGASKALRPQSADMNYIEYNNLDFILLAVLPLTFVIALFSSFMSNCIANYQVVSS